MGLSNSFLFLAIGWLTHNPYPDVFKQNFTLFVSWSYCNSLECRCTEIKAGSGNNCGSTEHCDQSSPALNPGTIQGVHIWHSYAMDLTTAGWLLKPNTQTKQCFKAFARKLCMHFTDWSGTEANSAIIDVSPLKSPRHPRKTRRTKSVGKAVKNRAAWEGNKKAPSRSQHTSERQTEHTWALTHSAHWSIAGAQRHDWSKGAHEEERVRPCGGRRTGLSLNLYLMTCHLCHKTFWDWEGVISGSA